MKTPMFGMKLNIVLHLCNKYNKAFSENTLKLYPCNQCPKAFSIDENLEKHLRIHSGENHIFVINVSRLSSKVVI